MPAPSLSASARGSDTRLRVPLVVGFLLLYVALEWLSFIHEYKGVPITPWNPGLGVVFALMLFAGPLYAVVLFVGIVIAEMLVLKTNLQWPTILGIAAIITLVYAGATWLARRHFRLDVTLKQLRDVIALLGVGLLGAVLATLLLSVLLILEPDLDWTDALIALVPLLVGDTIGIAVVTPLMLRVLHKHPLPTFSHAVALEVAVYVALIAGSLWVIAATGEKNGVKFFYLLFLPIVLSALRFGMDGACVALALAQLGLVGVLQFFAADARTFTEFQILMLVLSTTGLIVGAVVSERERADAYAREAERRFKEKEAEAVQASRFTLVSGMASALAHEINQPLTAARALARSAQELLRQKNDEPARVDANLTNVITYVDHASGIVRRIREFLRRGHPRISTIDPVSVLESAILLAGPEAAAKGVTLSLSPIGTLPNIFGDRVQLQQVVLNLVRNSIDAIGDGSGHGKIIIEARQLSTPARIEFSVLDDGPGIDEETAGRLFEPLMTSKHEGLGLGLAICTSIVEAHGGKLWLHSRAAGATEFRFTIPVETKQGN
ncbi:MAG: ATP-binding protein [Xanthobacteraceae bacterium]